MTKEEKAKLPCWYFNKHGEPCPYKDSSSGGVAAIALPAIIAVSMLQGGAGVAHFAEDFYGLSMLPKHGGMPC